MSASDPSTRAYDAVLFDLLTALLDSWTLWNSVAGDAGAGGRWRAEYLRITYAAGGYRPYEDLVAKAAHDVGLPRNLAKVKNSAQDTPNCNPGQAFATPCAGCMVKAFRLAW